MKVYSFSKQVQQTAKIAIGSSAAIFVATFLHLEFASSAGIIALLTTVSTKWDTVKLTATRFLSFATSVMVALVVLQVVELEWIAYGIYIFIMVLLCNYMEWKATISVNAVVGTHFLTTQNFTVEFLENEFLLLVIGTSFAVLLNLYHGNRWQKKLIIEKMRYTEGKLQMIIGELAAYIANKKMERNVWTDIENLEREIQDFVAMAHEYQGNTFQSHPEYYIDYFEMRRSQCNVLNNLHYEAKKIRMRPKQAHVLSEYMLYMMDYVVEINDAQEQIRVLENLAEEMKNEELPKTREEFESRALLYHMLMDLEEFLFFKRRFVRNLDAKQMKRYWNQENEDRRID